MRTTVLLCTAALLTAASLAVAALPPAAVAPAAAPSTAQACPAAGAPAGPATPGFPATGTPRPFWAVGGNCWNTFESCHIACGNNTLCQEGCECTYCACAGLLCPDYCGGGQN